MLLDARRHLISAVPFQEKDQIIDSDIDSLILVPSSFSSIIDFARLFSLVDILSCQHKNAAGSLLFLAWRLNFPD